MTTNGGAGNDNGGRFTKGHDPRRGPGSRAPKTAAEVRELAAGHGPEVIERLIGIVRDAEADPQAVIAAGRVLLDRGFGRAPQMTIALDGTDRREARLHGDWHPSTRRAGVAHSEHAGRSQMHRGWSDRRVTRGR